MFASVNNKFQILLNIPVDEQKGDHLCFLIRTLMVLEIILNSCCLSLLTCGLLLFTVRCTEPPVTGSCRDSFSKWYYNPIQKACLRFNYGGCQGNENRFDTEEHCMRVCRGVTGESTLMFQCVLPNLSLYLRHTFPFCCRMRRLSLFKWNNTDKELSTRRNVNTKEFCFFVNF